MSVSDLNAARGHRGTDRIGFGIAMSVVAVLVFGLQDAVSKILVQSYSPFQISMMRYWGFALFCLLVVTRQAPLRQALRSRAPMLQVLRGTLLVADIWLFAIALQTVPLGELQGITLIYPLLVTLFAIPLLGERVGIFRFAAVLVGFAGALLIVRPGGLQLGWGVGAAVLSATLYGLYIVLTRKVSAHDSTPVSMFYVALVGLLLTTAVGVFHWQALDLEGLALIGFITVTTCIAHGLMTWGLSLAPASVLQPFNYLSLPWAIVLSYLVFHHVIDAIAFLGALITVAAGLVVMAREKWKQRMVIGVAGQAAQE